MLRMGQPRSMRGRDKLNDTRDGERRSNPKYGYVSLEGMGNGSVKICGEFMGLSFLPFFVIGIRTRARRLNLGRRFSKRRNRDRYAAKKGLSYGYGFSGS